VVQGDTTMKCQKLVVFYGQEVGIAQKEAGQGGAPAPDTKPALAGPKGAQNIRRIEARGGVTVITKDQNASGDLGVYDLIAKTITLTGNVVVSQGQNVIHGERVVVDTVSGNARVESNNQGGGGTPTRVRALIQPNQNQNGGGNVMTIGPGAPGKPN
jgi:lipopolysaccharide export system protein LptA